MESAVWKYKEGSILHGTWKEHRNYSVNLLIYVIAQFNQDFISIKNSISFMDDNIYLSLIYVARIEDL